MNSRKLGNPKVGNPKARDRGRFRVQKSPKGQADYAEVCLRLADGSYMWQRLGTQSVEASAPQVEVPAQPVEASAQPVEASAPQAEIPATQVEASAVPATA